VLIVWDDELTLLLVLWLLLLTLLVELLLLTVLLLLLVLRLWLELLLLRLLLLRLVWSPTQSVAIANNRGQCHVLLPSPSQRACSLNSPPALIVLAIVMICGMLPAPPPPPPMRPPCTVAPSTRIRTCVPLVAVSVSTSTAPMIRNSRCVCPASRLMVTKSVQLVWAPSSASSVNFHCSTLYRLSMRRPNSVASCCVCPPAPSSLTWIASVFVLANSLTMKNPWLNRFPLALLFWL
jgi:hypothetical protein